jgi:GAF domain-containing protein
LETLDFFSLEPLRLREEEITELSLLAEQLAGVIYGAILFTQVQEEKEKALTAQQGTEKQKQETEGLNQLIKSLNEELDLKVIMEKVIQYVIQNYFIQNIALYIVDSDKKNISMFFSNFPDYVIEEERQIIYDSKISIQDEKGAHAFVYRSKKYFYIPNAQSKRALNAAAPEELFVIEKLKVNSFMLIPLLLNNDVIGILDFSTHSNKLQLSKEDITKLSILGEQLAGIIHGSNLFKQVQEEKEKALVAQKETEKQKQETEELNKLIKSLNEELDLKVIMQKVLHYINKNFGLEYFGLYNVNPEKTHHFLLYANFPKYLSDNDINIIMNSSIPLTTEKGAHAFVFKTNKHFYVPNVQVKRILNAVTKEELFVIEKYKIKSFLIIPLILNNQPIGTLDFSNAETKMELSKEDITKLSILGEQLAGIIHGSNLLKQVQEEKEKALFLKIEADAQKQETDNLNELIKSLNEDLNIQTIMQKVYFYIKINYNIHYYGLAVVDKEKEFAITVDTHSPDFISSEDKERISQFSTKVKDVVGAHALAFKSKRPFFAPRIRKSGMTEEEILNQEVTKLESILIIPLILQNEPIGFLDLYNVGKMELSKEDITKLSILGEQLAGIIHGSNLFKQVQEEKEKANAAREEAEKAKAQIEFLNEFSKVINSYNNLDIIFSHAVENLSKKIDTDIFQLQLVDKAKNELFTRCLSGTDSGLMKKYNKLRVPLIPESGSLYLAYASKKTLYLKKIQRIAENKKSVLDKMVEKDFQIDSVFQIPLLVNEEVIGIMSINKSGGMKKLSKDEIRFVESLCEQLALAVNNSFLLEAAKSERQKSEKLLLNILPKDVASELKEKGFAEPVLFENVSVMFTDFKGFTTIAETLTPQELIKDLDACFVQFDKISERFNLEKLKTIGDSYMCAGGIPKRNKTHAIDCCLAALEIQSFMNLMKKLKEEQGYPYWELRLGIHTGPLIAGVIGERKFAYDVWGDTVNTASRMESSGTPGRINISYSTYEVVKDFFVCEYRGEVSAKNKGVVKMYYLDRIKPEFSKDEEGLMPNGKFWEMYG